VGSVQRKTKRSSDGFGGTNTAQTAAYLTHVCVPTLACMVNRELQKQNIKNPIGNLRGIREDVMSRSLTIVYKLFTKEICLTGRGQSGDTGKNKPDQFYSHFGVCLRQTVDKCCPFLSVSHFLMEH
jgi:hypothetical protein